MPSINGSLIVTSVTTTEWADGTSHDLVQFTGTVDLPGPTVSPPFTFSIYRPHNVNAHAGDQYTIVLTKV